MLRAFSLVLLGVLVDSAQAQFTRLTFQPIEADYSSALDRIVMISTSPNLLRIYDAAARTEQTVALSRVPLSLSLSPNGRFAAVGHDGAITYVNLTTAAIDRTYSVTGPVQRVVLGTDWVYSMSPTLLSVRLSTGAVTTPTSSFSTLTSARLHPQERTIYGFQPFYGPLHSFDVSAGPLGQPLLSIGNSLDCAPVWFSADVQKYYTGCATISRYADRAPDATLLTTFPGISRMSGVAESSTRIAVIPLAPGTGSEALDSTIRLYNSVTVQEIGRFQLSSFSVSGSSYTPHGRWVFFNTAGTALHVLSQADNSSGLINDYALQSYALVNPAPCFATFSASTVTVPAAGSVTAAQITAPSDCVFQAATTTPWIQIVSGGFGSGNGTLAFHARANTSASARTGTITMGSQTLTVNQGGASLAVPSVQSLSYKVTDAEFSKELDRIVFVSAGPNELHVYDPATRTDQFVPLGQMPLSVSVHPNGLSAAVGHVGSITLVNLQTPAVDRVIPIPVDAADIVLAGNGYAYVFSSRSGTLHSVQLSNNTVTATAGNFGQSVARLYSTGNFIYAATGSFSNWKFDIRNGAATPVTSNTSSVYSCGNHWLSEDGIRLYTQCGSVYRTSETPTLDLVPNGSFSAANTNTGQGGVGWVAHSSQKASVALVRAIQYFAGPDLQNDVQLYADEGLVLQGRLALTPYSDGNAVHGVYGRYVFWNKAATRLYAVNQVANTAGLLSDFLVETVLVDTFSGCGVTLQPTSVDVSASGGAVVVGVNTGANCIWSASTTDYSMLSISSAAGAGNGSLTINVYSNNSQTQRTGTVLIGGRTFTVRQAASSGIVLSGGQTSFGASGGSSPVFVNTTSPTLAWVATTTAPWITLQSASGTGSSPFFFLVAPNTGPARTGSINVGSEALTITQAAGVPANPGLRFVPMSPCRVVDTRGESGQTGAFGTPVMAAGSQRDFPIPAGACNVPATAAAYSFNVTVVPRGPLAFLTVWPAGQGKPLVSTLNSFDGRIKANAAIVPAGTGGGVSVYVTDATEVILDINGYFVPDSVLTPPSYLFRNVNPCRVVDTRLANGVNGGPSLTAGQSRSFSFNTGACGLFAGAAAYSLNITAIPKGSGLSYLTAWPSGAARPFASTLNSFTGTVVANAAIVPAGLNGEISVFVTDPADVVIDVNGFFTSSTGPNLKFYPVAPCRVSDSRLPNGPFGGPILGAQQLRGVGVSAGSCLIPGTALAYVLNATVVPSAALSYLTLFPSGQTQPMVSTLNAYDGAITSNALILPAGTSGNILGYVTDATHLILDTSGYFAP